MNACIVKLIAYIGGGCHKTFWNNQLVISFGLNPYLGMKGLKKGPLSHSVIVLTPALVHFPKGPSTYYVTPRGEGGGTASCDMAWQGGGRGVTNVGHNIFVKQTISKVQRIPDVLQIMPRLFMKKFQGKNKPKLSWEKMKRIFLFFSGKWMCWKYSC